MEPTELAGFLAGQVLAVHPAYEVIFEGFHPDGLRGEERTQWAAEGAPFTAKHIIETSDVAFDDFASSSSDFEANRRILGLT